MNMNMNISNMMKQPKQQFGGLGSGSQIGEQFIGSLLKDIMPKQPAMPSQLTQGGMGNMGKLAMGHGNNSLQRYVSQPNLQRFLQQYGQTGKRNVKFANLNKLTKF